MATKVANYSPLPLISIKPHLNPKPQSAIDALTQQLIKSGYVNVKGRDDKLNPLVNRLFRELEIKLADSFKAKKITNLHAFFHSEYPHPALTSCPNQSNTIPEHEKHSASVETNILPLNVPVAVCYAVDKLQAISEWKQEKLFNLKNSYPNISSFEILNKFKASNSGTTYIFKEGPDWKMIWMRIGKQCCSEGSWKIGATKITNKIAEKELVKLKKLFGERGPQFPKNL